MSEASPIIAGPTIADPIIADPIIAGAGVGQQDDDDKKDSMPIPSTSAAILAKECSLCSLPCAVGQVERYPTGYQRDHKIFDPMSNRTFCRRACVREFLVSQMSYLQTLYSFYCLTVHGDTMTYKSPNPLLLRCRQIQPTKDALTLQQYYDSVPGGENRLIPEPSGKQCTLCFRIFSHPPNSYVTEQKHGIYQLANLAFCCPPCVLEWLKLNKEPLFMNLFQEYRAVMFHENPMAMALDPKCLASRQFAAETVSLTMEQFHESHEMPKMGLDPNHYFTVDK